MTVFILMRKWELGALVNVGIAGIYSSSSLAGKMKNSFEKYSQEDELQDQFFIIEREVFGESILRMGDIDAGVKNAAITRPTSLNWQS